MIAIIGGGICGLSIGWRLAQAGRPVTVFERGEAGMAATWASAGMLAPQAEAEHAEEALLPLAMQGRAMWAGFAAELAACTGIDVDYRGEGTLVVALDRDEREALEHRYEYLRGLGLPVDWLSGREARENEPALARTVVGAIRSAADHQVDNRRVARALRAAFLKAGGTLREHAEVEGLVTAADRASAVVVAGEEVAAETVVLAAGAWSRNLKGLPDAVRPPVRPLKGQMVALRMAAGAPLIRHVVWGPGRSIVPGIYLAPKSDGRLVVGATVEEAGFDTQLTAGGLFELLRHCWATLPASYDLVVDEVWAGLRPTSRDDAPILGPAALDGLVVATGHHRNGILLAPLTAATISRYILTGAIDDAIRPFLPDRFRRAESAAGR
jgi:glycine oxidase